MNKKFFINVLALLFSFSAFAVKPNIQQNRKKRAPIAVHNRKETPIEAHTDNVIFDEQTETSTFSESWGKVIRLKWTSLSRNDAWNIGASLVTCGAIVYLYNHMQKNPIENNAIHNPHDNQGPDNGNKIHIHKPRPQNTNKVHIHKPKPHVVNNPVPVIIPVDLPVNKQPADPIKLVPSAQNDEEKECELCGEDKKGHKFCTLSCCGYNSTCSDCLTEMINIALKEKTTAELKCPNRNCTQSMCEQDMRTIAGGKLDDYHNVTVKEYLDKNKEQNGIKFCPTTDCPYAFENDAGHRQLTTCPTCKHTYCSNCCVEHSMTRTCDQAKEDLKLKENKTKEEKETDEWLQNNTKACPQCKAPVEKRGGCLSMLCTRCQHQFCWKCLQPHDHSMNHACGLWDNDAQMNQAHEDLIQELNNPMGQFAQGFQQGFNNQGNGMNAGNFFNDFLRGMLNGLQEDLHDLRMRQAQQQQNNQQNDIINNGQAFVNGQRVNIQAQQQNNRVNIGNAVQNRNNNNNVNVNANRPNNNANAQNNNRPAVNMNNVNRPVVNNANANRVNNANVQNNNRQGANANANRPNNNNNANVNRNGAAKGARK